MLYSLFAGTSLIGLALVVLGLWATRLDLLLAGLIVSACVLVAALAAGDRTEVINEVCALAIALVGGGSMSLLHDRPQRQAELIFWPSMIIMTSIAVGWAVFA